MLWHLSSEDQFIAVKDQEELPIKTVTIWQITTFVFSLDIYQADRALIPDAWMKVCVNKCINQLVPGFKPPVSLNKNSTKTKPKNPTKTKQNPQKTKPQAKLHFHMY